MRYYKLIENGYITAIGTGGGGTEITEEEYGVISEIIRTKPQETDTQGYHLRTNLTWEPYDKVPPVPDDTPPDGLDAAASYLLENDMMTMPEPDPEPDYLNEHEPEPDYFG